MHFIPLVFLATLPNVSTACRSSNHTLETLKRTPWFGVGNPHGNEPRSNNAWPADPISPWQNALRYCFVSQPDYTNLNPALQKAIALWQPAIGPKDAPFSSLVIRPDGSGQNADILCSDAQPDALQISDIDSSDSNVQGHATVGYWTQEKGQETKGRHQLAFERIQNRDTPQRPGDYDVASLAHELGHALGLEHEHQRPDRDQYLTFTCSNLRDYPTIARLLQPPDTMHRACTDLATAQRYGFSAAAYVPLDRGPVLGQLAHSARFDYDSLMTYGSYEGAAVNGADTTKAVLLRRPGGTEFFQGGAPAWRAGEMRISAGDMARIAQLYPNAGARGDDAGARRAAQTSWAGTSRGDGRGGGKRAVETGAVRT